MQVHKNQHDPDQFFILCQGRDDWRDAAQKLKDAGFTYHWREIDPDELADSLYWDRHNFWGSRSAKNVITSPGTNGNSPVEFNYILGAAC